MDWQLLGFKGLTEVYNVHPVFVHFPIALFPTTLLFYFTGVVWKKERWVSAGRLLLWLAFLSAAVTVITGELAEDTIPHSDTIHFMMETHEKIGITALVLSGLLAVWSFWGEKGKPKKIWGFLLILAATALIVLQNGDIGGRMVFMEGAAVKKAIQPNKYHHQHHHPH